MEIAGYEIIGDFKMAGGGMSTWTFARRDGKEYFIKRFLAPKYPVPGSPGSARTLARKRAECEEFEAQRREVMRVLKPRCGSGGNLVAPIGLFRSGAWYYGISEKIDVADGMQPERIAALPVEQRLFIMQTVSYSLRILHDVGIVHGDLKPANILIKRAAKGAYVAKIIDIDDSYFAGRPPRPESVVGDPVYYSPELARYVTGGGTVSGSTLHTSSDLFALGVVYTLYLTGNRPVFDTRKYQYAWQAVSDGITLAPEGTEIAPEVVECVRRMLQQDPETRPSVTEVFDTLRRAGAPAVTAPATPKPPMPDAMAPRTAASLRGTLTSPAANSPPTAGLRGSLVRRDR
jgi:serine/threonine protein kinase